MVLERKMGLDNYNVSRGTIIMNFLVLFQGWVFDGFAFILFLFLSSGFKGVFYLRKTNKSNSDLPLQQSLLCQLSFYIDQESRRRVIKNV